MNNGLRHLAIIMDGNGRWAKTHGYIRSIGHREGVKNVETIIDETYSHGIEFLSLYAFSTENWLRPKDEVSYLMELMDKFISSKSLLKSLKTHRLVVSGCLEGIPANTANKITNLVAQTQNNKGLVINMAINYGGRDEIVVAAKALAQDALDGKILPNEITETALHDRTYNAFIPNIDFLIRTGGDHRISNFMLWRIAYSELYITTTMWPDFKAKQLKQALDDYYSRERRYGALGAGR